MSKVMFRSAESKNQSSHIRGYTADFVFLLVLAGLAFILRKIAARIAHPACGDALHFIEDGWQLAQGDPAGLSSYWSQGQILMAALAFKLGWDPQLTLQAVSMYAGTLSAPLLYLLARRLRIDRIPAFLAGLFVGINPFLINMSITGYSEIPYLAGIMIGTVFILDPARGWWRWGSAALSGIGYGVAVYFRITDAMIMIVVAAVFGLVNIALINKALLRIYLARLALIFVFMAICLFPSAQHSYQMTGSWLPSSSKVQTIVQGEDAYDSRWMYGLNVTPPWQEAVRTYKDSGLVGYLWNYRDVVARRAIINLANIVRISSDNSFSGPIRLGPAAFLLLTLSIALVLLRDRQWPVLILSSLWLGIHSMALAIYFIFPRYTTTTTMVLGLFLGVGFGIALHRSSGHSRWLLLAACLVYLTVMGRTSTKAFHLEFMWHHYSRWVAVADDLPLYLEPGDVFMAQHTMVLAQRMGIYDSARYVALPYAEVDEITQFCRERNVRWMIASDTVRPHWPVSSIVRDLAPPSPWRVVKVWEFDGVPWVDPPERIVLFERFETD